MHIPGSIEPITLIWVQVSLERSFPPTEVEHLVKDDDVRSGTKAWGLFLESPGNFSGP